MCTTVVTAGPAAAAPNPVVAVNDHDTPAQILEKAASLTPSQRQLDWQLEELTGFIHFGPNTFTFKEWGTGTEDPDVFNPTNLDTDQWAEMFKEAGFKKVILTAKHHDGMLLFPSAYSSHGVASSNWMSGKGNVLKSFTDSFRNHGLKVGVYLSPSDGHEYHAGRFGNGSTPKPTHIPTISDGTDRGFDFPAVDDYNRYYMNTFYEVLTKYGKLDEIWLDGANPWPDAPQRYNFSDWITMIRTLQPTAVVFQDGGPDARFVGTEEGLTHRVSEWSAVPNIGDPATAADSVIPVPGGSNSASDLGSDALLSQRNADGTSKWDMVRWQPAECDGMLQAPSWFWDPGAKPVSLATLQHMYMNSVGKNCQLLLNVAPDNTGRMPAEAVDRMRQFGSWVRSLNVKVSSGASAANDTGTSNTSGNVPSNVLDGDGSTAWQPNGTTGNLVMDLGPAKTFNVVKLQENIQVGQRVSSFAFDVWDGNGWQEAGKATTIGYKRLLHLPNAVTTTKVRLRINTSRALSPAIATFSLHSDGAIDTNMAFGKSATQSSTLTGSGQASRAADGNADGSFPAGSVTHTSETPLDNNPWWQVDLGTSQTVGQIKLWNRTDCCSNRLRDFYVFASDTPFTSNDPATTKAQTGVWHTHRSEAVGTSLTLPVGTKARYIRVQLVGSDRPLSLSEVEVFANMALNRPATQSSTHHLGSSADRAVDGKADGIFFAGSVTHTSDTPLDNNPWWQVDLGTSQTVGQIKLWNRTDCCSNRLRDFYVFASDTPFTSNDPATTKAQTGVWHTHRSEAVGTSLTLPVGTKARYIRVQLVGSDRPLSLSEVQVLG
ncbi:discoidin domain-containing protein [Streptomyces sp. NBC_00887]|uniref:galactose-binding domain-containing protein n=1 Tax=Streptomyces sp. NBC_00887 TaxID=2975859 RepID=UPI0038654743|nr:alpha-L-fucosidase [Streptomyces sp. NBC_00887]WSY36330.1 alpha-L-fucosidase [Streptomyces sp. NBC_00887]